MDTNEFVAGIDPSVLAQISGAQLLQLIASAGYTPTRGGLITSDDEPDVVVNPKFLRYEWRKPSEKYKICRVYNIDTATWEPSDQGNLSVGTAQLQDGAVTLAKLYNPNDVTKAGYLIKVNPTGTGFILEAFAIADNSIDLIKLNKGVGNGNKIPHIAADNSGWEYISISDVVAATADGSISISKLNPAGQVGTIVITNSNGDSYALLAPGTPGYVLRSSALGPYWSAEASRVITNKSTSANQAIPAAVGQITYAHGLGAIPTNVQIKAICTVNDGDYVVGDIVPMECIMHQDGGGTVQYPIGISYNSTNIIITFSANALILLRKDGTNLLALTRASWSLQIVALL